MANEGYHEPIDELSDETRDMHRAIVSLMEELEAVDWYNQRVDACKDAELKAILAHNRDEEKEHAAMVLEWIRRKDPRFDKELKDYLLAGALDRPAAAQARQRLQERQRRHDQSQGPRTGKSESGPESQKAGRQRRACRPKNPSGTFRSGSRLDKRPQRERRHQELRRGETWGGALEIDHTIAHPSPGPCGPGFGGFLWL
jgi:ferritin-like protein